MRRLSVTALHDGPLVRAVDADCAAPHSGCGAAEHAAAAELILPRRGVFAVHRVRDVFVADAASVVVLRAGEEYRVSHPGGHGDACTSLTFAPDVVEEALGDRPAAYGTLRPVTQRRAALLTAGLRRGAEALEAEEGALGLLDAVAGDLRERRPAPPAAAARAAQVRALLASNPAADWRLASVAAAVHCSPFHLARQFRAATGETIAGYVMRLRLALAAERVAAGERELARLAHELGFAHHSHLSARFRALFAMSPRELRTIVTAQAPPRS